MEGVGVTIESEIMKYRSILTTTLGRFNLCLPCYVEPILTYFLTLSFVFRNPELLTSLSFGSLSSWTILVCRGFKSLYFFERKKQKNKRENQKTKKTKVNSVMVLNHPYQWRRWGPWFTVRDVNKTFHRSVCRNHFIITSRTL